MDKTEKEKLNRLYDACRFIEQFVEEEENFGGETCWIDKHNNLIELDYGYFMAGLKAFEKYAFDLLLHASQWYS